MGWLCVDFYGFCQITLREISASGLDSFGGEATIFRFEPVFSIKRPSNPIGQMLVVMTSSGGG